jgi:hypothetical protein
VRKNATSRRGVGEGSRRALKLDEMIILIAFAERRIKTMSQIDLNHAGALLSASVTKKNTVARIKTSAIAAIY